MKRPDCVLSNRNHTLAATHVKEASRCSTVCVANCHQVRVFVALGVLTVKPMLIVNAPVIRGAVAVFECSTWSPIVLLSHHPAAFGLAL